ncbi:MAG: tRNA (N6-isopentenyl adenosine(37)-C2)-methylthiotransferase MiaB [Kiloniellales bacterium]
MTKRLFIKTYGCQMNVYDSARMADVLAPLGYRPWHRPEGADMVILNTCHIREKAAEKVYSELGRIRRLKEARAAVANGGDRRMIVAVAGCVAQAEGEEILRRAPCVDIVFGPQTYHRLPEMVARACRAAGEPVLDTEFPIEPKFDRLPEEAAPQGVAAYLTVQEGCDRFCSFCVVPYTRGAEYSRDVAAVLAEARRLVARGAVEITLLGQNVNAYHGLGPDRRPWRLGRLIRELADIDGLERLRYTTSHPRDMDDELIAAHRDVPQLMPHLHLPVQSGSDRVLAAMNRQHKAADYHRLVARLREARPDIALTSDFIVGFPGESERDFERTLDLVRRVGFAGGFSFCYSPRPGTPAAVAARAVDEAIKLARLARLQALISEQQGAFNRVIVGRVVPVLFEKPGRHPGQLIGRSPWMQAVHAEAPARWLGRIAPVRISRALANSLAGRVEIARRASAAGGAVAARLSA